MRYWWVNQNQTFRHEVAGGYLWSPKRRNDGVRNYFYETMREVAPGDIVFSFADTLIPALGMVTSFGYESPKPEEFGTVGSNWSRIGWRVDVEFHELLNKIRPKDHMPALRPTLPERYSPLRTTGDGNQGVYLTEVPPPMALVLIDLIGLQAKAIAFSSAELVAERPTPLIDPSLHEKEVVDWWEEDQEREIAADAALRETEREALVKARKGQGLFRTGVSEVENHCRVTLVDNPTHLIAGHIKPWRHSTNEERLDGENGLLLTPTIDHLFDRGFITFSGNGKLICSPVADQVSLRKMGVPTDNEYSVGAFSRKQREFLTYHEDEIFKRVSRPGESGPIRRG